MFQTPQRRTVTPAAVAQARAAAAQEAAKPEEKPVAPPKTPTQLWEIESPYGWRARATARGASWEIESPYASRSMKNR